MKLIEYGVDKLKTAKFTSINCYQNFGRYNLLSSEPEYCVKLQLKTVDDEVLHHHLFFDKNQNPEITYDECPEDYLTKIQDRLKDFWGNETERKIIDVLLNEQLVHLMHIWAISHTKYLKEQIKNIKRYIIDVDCWCFCGEEFDKEDIDGGRCTKCGRII